MENVTIAIDGPAGAGKSTIAKELASKLGCIYLDTGAMYRSLALKALRTGISVCDESALCGLLNSTEIEVSYIAGTQCVKLDGKSVTDEIRTREVSNAASMLSTLGGVRREMVSKQQRIAAGQSVVMDGRDIGTCVLPEATLKVFLTASPEVRAQRRLLDMPGADYAQILADVRDRDYRDTTRAESPLRRAEDAIELDCSELAPAQVVEAILAELEARV